MATVSDDTTARLWDIRDPHKPLPLAVLTGMASGVDSVALSPDRHTLASANSDNTVRLWDLRDPDQPRPLATLTGHTSGVHSVAFSPDGRTLATSSDDTTARLWNVSDPLHPSRADLGQDRLVVGIAGPAQQRTGMPSLVRASPMTIRGRPSRLSLEWP